MISIPARFASHLYPQLHLAEVSPTLLRKVRATPRYDTLMELKNHWAIDLRASKETSSLNPAEAVLSARSELDADGSPVLPIHLPFREVCRLWACEHVVGLILAS